MSIDLQEVFDRAGFDAPPTQVDRDVVMRKGRRIRMRRRAAVGVTATVGVGVIAAGSMALRGDLHQRGPTVAPLSTQETSQLTTLLLRTATAMGDPSPTDARVAKTDLKTAMDASHGGSSGTYGPATSVFLVVASGQFTGAGEFLPPGEKPIPGSIITITVDARTMQSIGTSVTNNPVDTSMLGSLAPLG